MCEWVWSISGMILTGENWSTGRETLYSVGGRCMNEYGALVGWYWQGKTEVLGETQYTALVVDEWMSMEHWWDDSDRGNPKYWEKNLSQCQFVHHKFHVDCPGIEPGPPLWQAGEWPPVPRHGLTCNCVSYCGQHNKHPKTWNSLCTLYQYVRRHTVLTAM
jgi:hypothetical protein